MSIIRNRYKKLELFLSFLFFNEMKIPTSNRVTGSSSIEKDLRTTNIGNFNFGGL